MITSFLRVHCDYRCDQRFRHHLLVQSHLAVMAVDILRNTSAVVKARLMNLKMHLTMVTELALVIPESKTLLQHVMMAGELMRWQFDLFGEILTSNRLPHLEDLKRQMEHLTFKRFPGEKIKYMKRESNQFIHNCTGQHYPLKTENITVISYLANDQSC